VKTRCIIFGVGSLLAISLVQAGPPFVTDDPEPPPPGGWEINIPFMLERSPGKTEMNAPLFDFNYGLPDVQLKLEVPIGIVHNDGDGTAAGAGDLLLGVKWRFLNNEESHLQLGVYPQLLIPTGDHARGLGQVGRRSSCRSSRRKVGASGPFTATLAFGGKPPPKRAITFTLARCSSAKSTND
jgi:hypothetical protein